MTFSLPAGRTGEKTALEAGMHELSEEVQLKAPEDRWQLLGPDKGVPEGKVRRSLYSLPITPTACGQWITSMCVSVAEAHEAKLTFSAAVDLCSSSIPKSTLSLARQMQRVRSLASRLG